MKKHILLCLTFIGMSVMCATVAQAQGFVSFQNNGPTGTTVTAGDAGSFMRAGLDWNKSDTIASGAFHVAVPNILMPAKITTYRDATNLTFKFSIPYTTEVKPDGSVLDCGDQVIVQISKRKTAATNLDTTGVDRYYRYVMVIKNNAFVSGVTKYLPRLAFGSWGWNPTAASSTTSSVSALSAAGNKHEFTLTVPLSEVGSPATDIGVAIALINDLGHSHVDGSTINEATGTALPLTMGVVPESDPGLACGPSNTALVSGNWLNPSTWGTGYWTASAAPTVTLSHTPQYTLSNAIRLGNCSAMWSDIQPVPSASNWSSFQQDAANNWYLYHEGNPCRMAIWINASVSGAGVTTRRFFVVWGRPGISPQEWYFAGITNPVAVSAPETQLSFIWEKPNAVSFSSHPCMKVYILKEGITNAGVDSIKAINSDATLTVAVNRYVDNATSQQSAQMNFNNMTTGSCPTGVCSPSTIGLRMKETRTVARAGIGFRLWGALQQRTRGDDRQDPRSDSIYKVRVLAQGYGIAQPAANRPYVYVEPIGTVGWFVGSDLFADSSLALTFDVSNPKTIEAGYSNGRPVEIAAPARRILVALSVEAPPGKTAPRIDVRGLNQYAGDYMEPGATHEVKVTLAGAGVGTGPGDITDLIKQWWWLILLIILLLLIFAILRRRP